ncbi:hypothetical protein F4808DRAFT_413895 [Astrocystis sublimbata]|nr:hypothetical protein F4808DRAFT_413895 [Astrocystis sublimbata]
MTALWLLGFAVLGRSMHMLSQLGCSMRPSCGSLQLGTSAGIGSLSEVTPTCRAAMLLEMLAKPALYEKRNGTRVTEELSTQTQYF